MTDSGFSSASSTRSASTIIKPSLLNNLAGATTSAATSKGIPKESSAVSSTSASYKSLPKPSPYFQASGCRPVLPNRFLSNKGNGGYSPSIYSPKEMSPLSSLAYDFGELNTSREQADTPCKRLSLSSTSSLDSLHLRGHPSPAALSFASSLNSPQVLPDDEGCFADTPSPLDLADAEKKFDYRAFQERDGNVLSSGQPSFRRFKSMPGTKPCTFRPWGSDCPGKENDSPLLSSAKQNFPDRRVSVDSPSPLRTMNALAAASPFNSFSRRRHSAFLSPSLASSPLAANFTSSSSSAFSNVHQAGSHQPPASQAQRDNQEELRKSAEEALRDVKSPTNTSLTPEKSVVPGSISSLSARTRPASAAPFYREKSHSPDRLSPILSRGSKRSLDHSNTSIVLSTKRHKLNTSASVDASSATRGKVAFGSKDRKVKSAEASVMHSSPISALKASFRPISAPSLELHGDEEPLSHSRLCSSNDSESDGDDVMVTSSNNSQDVDEVILEELLTENTRSRKGAVSDDVINDAMTREAPAGIDGLMKAPLLLGTSATDGCENAVIPADERMVRPRELFRSPSAPPLVPSRKALNAIRRAEEKRSAGDTPFRSRHASRFPDIPTVHEVSCHEMDEEPSSVLNRSRSFNELDIMRAVDLGCSDDNLIGDFSRVCSLQTVTGKCQDLKYITPHTLIELINNQHDVGCFEIIDCRYPYEYAGGHVRGASLVWEEEALFKKFLENPRPMWAASDNGTYKHPVLVFYCEFSSERGPRMARALRNRDRRVNRYPHLHYPEIYLLKDGYKNFYHTEGARVYCEPMNYRPMAHQNFTRELRLCRNKSKTLSGEKAKSLLYGRVKK